MLNRFRLSFCLLGLLPISSSADELEELQAIRAIFENVFIDGGSGQDALGTSGGSLQLIADLVTASDIPLIRTSIASLKTIIQTAIPIFEGSLGDLNSTLTSLDERDVVRDEILEDILEAIGSLQTANEDSSEAVNSSLSGISSAVASNQDGVEQAIQAMGANLEAIGNDQVAELFNILTAIQTFETSNVAELTIIANDLANLSINNSLENADILAALLDISLAVSDLEYWFDSNYYVGDSDDDVPMLTEIRDLLDGYGSNNAQNVVLGSRDLNGDFDDLREELDDMDDDFLNSGSDEVDASQGDDELLFTSISDLGAFAHLQEEVESLESTNVLTFNVTVPYLATQSPLANVGQEIDLFGGMEDFGLPSLDSFGGWVKLLISFAVLWWYCGHFNQTAKWYVEQDINATWTNPMTNMGGAFGGMINLPIKMGHIIFCLAFLGVIAGVLTSSAVVGDDSVAVALTNAIDAFTSSEGASSSLGGSAADYAWVDTFVDFVFIFLPLVFAITLFTYSWAVRWTVMSLFFFQIRMARAIS